MSAFSTRIKQLRVDLGLSQQALADKLGISKSSVNMYERGEREPGFETLETMATFFHVDMNYLLGSNSNILDPGGRIGRKNIEQKVSDKGIKLVIRIDSGLYERLCTLADLDNRSCEDELEYLLYWAVAQEIEEREE